MLLWTDLDKVFNIIQSFMLYSSKIYLANIYSEQHTRGQMSWQEESTPAAAQARERQAGALGGQLSMDKPCVLAARTASRLLGCMNWRHYQQSKMKLVRSHPDCQILFSPNLMQFKKDFNKLEWVHWWNMKLTGVWNICSEWKSWSCLSGEVYDETVSPETIFTLFCSIGLAHVQTWSPSCYAFLD